MTDKLSARKTTHVLKGVSGGWNVQKSGATKASRVFDSKEKAVVYGRDIARKSHSDLYVHRRDGRIESSDYYSIALPDSYYLLKKKTSLKKKASAKRKAGAKKK